MRQSVRKPCPLLGVLVVLGALCVAPPGLRAQPGMIGLVPVPSWGTHNMSDSQGYQWDFDQWGRVMNGTDSCFAQAFTLLIDNNMWQPRRRMMTADGSELVLEGMSPMHPGLEVTRRMRVDPKSVGCRFVDVFTNNTGAAVGVQTRVFLQSGNGGWQAAVSDTGQVNSGVLGKEETGLVLYGPSQNGTLSVALCLASGNAALRPSLQPPMTGQPGFNFSFTVLPHKTASIIYGAAQCRVDNQPDAKAVASLLRPFSGSSWLQDLPDDVRRGALNFRGFGDSQWDDVGIGKVLATLETNTTPNDILAFGAGTRLKGTASCTAISLETRFGTLKTALDKIVAIAGDRGHSGRAIVLFRDGQALTGKLHVENFAFTLNTGLQIDAPADRLDRLYMRAANAYPRSAEMPAAGGKPILLQTSDGERLALAPTGKEKMALVSPWGRIEFPLDNLVRVASVAEPPGQRIVLRDGTRLFGYLEAGTLRLATRSFGTLVLSPLDMHELRGPHEQDNDEATKPANGPAVPTVELLGENVLIGGVDLPALHIVTSGQSIAIPPGQIRKLKAGEADQRTEEVSFEAELWDGGKLVGKLAEGMLPLRCGNGPKAVPAHDVVEINVPAPVLSDAMRKKIADQIRDLGAGDYAKRKAAYAALVELGPLAKTQLSEAVQQTSDAEVRRAGRTILEKMGK